MIIVGFAAYTFFGPSAVKEDERLSSELAKIEMRRDREEKKLKGPEDENPLQRFNLDSKKLPNDIAQSFIKDYSVFFRRHSDKQIGWSAGLKAVKLHADLEKWADAEKLLGEINAKIPKSNSFYFSAAQLLKSAILEEQKKYDAALKTNRALISSGLESLRPSVYLSQARLYIAKGQKKEAMAQLDTILKENKDSFEASRARSLKIVLNKS